MADMAHITTTPSLRADSNEGTNTRKPALTRRNEMRKITLTLIASGAILAATVSGVFAHWTGGPMQNRAGAGAMMDQTQFGPGIMGPGIMMGGGMMSHGMMHMMTVMMDADGDGAVSQEEFQTVHARMFNAMDLDKDGKLTSDEMQEFMWSGSATPDENQ
jgi:hypothetical protein